MIDRVRVVLKDEFKRSSWVILIAVGCLLLCNMTLASLINKGFINLVNYAWHGIVINTVSWYLPVAFFLAISGSRSKKDDFWNSMPYTANELHAIRLAYGVGFIAIVGLLQLAVAAVVAHKYAFFAEDLSYLGYTLNGVYNYPMFLLIIVGGYIIASTIYGLVDNRIVASAMLFFISLMPELLFVPILWITGQSLDILDYASQVKYLIVFGVGVGDSDVNTVIYNIGVPLYLVIIAFMLWLGFYVNNKNHSSGNCKMFYNKVVKAVFIALSVLFALNITETLFF